MPSNLPLWSIDLKENFNVIHYVSCSHIVAHSQTYVHHLYLVGLCNTGISIDQHTNILYYTYIYVHTGVCMNLYIYLTIYTCVHIRMYVRMSEIAHGGWMVSGIGLSQKKEVVFNCGSFQNNLFYATTSYDLRHRSHDLCGKLVKKD